MFQIKLIEKIKTHILCSACFRKSCRLCNSVEKFVGAREAVESTAFVLCMLDNYGYTLASTRPSPCTHTYKHARTHARIGIHSRTRRAQSHTHTHTHTHTEIRNTAFPRQNGFVNALYLYAIRSLPLLLCLHVDKY